MIITIWTSSLYFIIWHRQAWCADRWIWDLLPDLCSDTTTITSSMLLRSWYLHQPE